MKVKKGFEEEWAEVSSKYAAQDAQGADIISLVNSFAGKIDAAQEAGEQWEFRTLVNWLDFMRDNGHMLTVDMTKNVMYLLVTYWVWGEELYEHLPPFEKLALTELVYEFSEEIKRRSAENSDAQG